MTSRVLDCDHVFDALTRGPFPAGRDDDRLVDAHLEVCHECRQLAEALRPAVDLAHESLREESLPEYLGRVPQAEEDEQAVATIMTRVRAENSIERPQPLVRWRVDPLSIIAAAVIGLVVGILASAPEEQPGHTASALRPVAYDPGPDGLAVLAKLDLQSACLVPGESVAPQYPHALENGFACCTQCHRYQAQPTSKTHSMAKLMQGCRACHDRV